MTTDASASASPAATAISGWRTRTGAVWRCSPGDAAPQAGTADADARCGPHHDPADAYLRTIVTLTRAVQTRDPYAAGRSERVTRLAQRIAGELGLGIEHNHAVAVGVVCADIGKIGLPDRLLHGRGHLSDEDYTTLRSYPAISSFILAELELPVIVKEMARWHLERWDGQGGTDELGRRGDPDLRRGSWRSPTRLDHKVFWRARRGATRLRRASRAGSRTRASARTRRGRPRCLAAEARALRDCVAA